MKKKLVFVLLIGLGLMRLPQAAAQAKANSIDKFLVARMKRMGIPGLQLAVIRDGRVVKNSSYGLANLQDSSRVTGGTVFQVNSITKAFVGVAVMQLAEAGKLDLEKPVGQYLDSLPADWQKVTLKQLLTQNSGIPNILDNNTGKLVGETDSAAWANVKKMPMEFAPGERFSYCQTNYVLIGKIINKITGGDFTRFIADKQLKVAGMDSSGFHDSRDVIPHAASVYTHFIFINDARYRTDELHNVFYEFSPFIRTTVGMNTTAGDLARWLICLQKGSFFTDPGSLQKLWTPGRLNNGQTAGFSRMFNGYAIGWPALVRAEHPAMAPIGAGSTAVFVYPKDNLSVIILTNLQGGNPEEFADEIAGFYIPEMRASNGFGLPPDIRAFRALVVKKEYKDAIDIFKALKKKNSKYTLDQNEVDIWGWTLVGQDQPKAALEVFKLNIYLNPKSAAAYDSYGGELEAMGQNEEAIRVFKQALQLDPKDGYALGHLQHLGANP